MEDTRESIGRREVGSGGERTERRGEIVGR